MNNCPLCKEGLSYREWSGELGLEEYIERCENPKCKGFADSWAFGYSDLKVGKWESGTFANHKYLTAKNLIDIVNVKEKEFALRVNYYRKRKSK